jgi:hypothetical protein
MGTSLGSCKKIRTWKKSASIINNTSKKELEKDKTKDQTEKHA